MAGRVSDMPHYAVHAGKDGPGSCGRLPLRGLHAQSAQLGASALAP